MGKFIDLTGRRFGRLVVLERAPSRKHKTYWKCRCDCGTEKEILRDSLLGGRTKSCGCLNLEMVHPHALTERATHLRLYETWHGMKARCLNPNYHHYDDYGGRGITVCKEWQESFDNFAHWADENGYVEGLTIDRIDVNKGYSPDNCRWATAKEQANNRRNTRYVTWNGITKPITEWCKEMEIDIRVVRHRLNYGWSVEDAFTVPVNHHKKRNVAN